MQRKIILQYYLLSCLFSAGGMQIISAVYVTFLIKNGLNLFQVNLVNTAYYLTLFVCEIPTGAFADIFGRKTSFVASCGLMSVSMFVYGGSHTFGGFICAEMIGAVASTFSSGAFQAWLVDSLKHHGYEDDGFRTIFGRSSLINRVCGSFGAVAGSYLAVTKPYLPWFIGGIVLSITTVVAFLTMREDYFIRKTFSFRRGLTSMKDVAVSSIRYGTQDKAVRFVLIVTGIQIFSVQAMNMYWQPFLKAHAVNEQHFGFVFVGMMTALAIGSFLASKMKASSDEKKTILRSLIWTGALIIGTVVVSGGKTEILMIVLFIAHEIPRGFWNPLMDGYLQKRIPSGERATVSSFCSMAPHIGGAIGLIASGAIAQCFGISAAWILSGTALITGALIISRMGKQATKNRDQT